jgi:tetratricopeptide (TPR) repeat protein
MSQLLSEAKKNYEEGVRYFNTERRTDGIGKFNEARQKTREVKLMFPVNQEAGILELRMDQVTDPRVFAESFDQRIRDAIAGTERRSNEAFAELQNLAQINPRYPNMAAIINQAEIDMGFRPPPPDPRALARSAELTTLARRIIEGNASSQYEVALAQVNEALVLNTNNAEASRIKVQLLTAMNAPGGIVMSSQDEAEFNRAAIAFQQGNYLTAYTIVERLLQDSRYRNITKLLELQRRIQAVLL